MGTQIAEPSQVQAGALTPATAGNFAIICYEKSQDNAGLKKLELVEWKQFMNYNGFKADNIAKIVGIDPSEYDYEHLIPDPAVDDTVRGQMANLAANAGVPLTPKLPTTPSLKEDIEELQDWVENGWDEESGGTTVHHDGLLDRTSTNETDIENIKNELGTAPGSGPNLFDRMNTAESDIDNLESIVGDPSADPKTGLVGKVETLEHTVDGYTQTETQTYEPGLNDYIKGWTDDTTHEGLLDRTSQLETTVGDSTNGLVKDVETLETTLGDSTDGLVKDVETLQDEVETPNTGLLDRVTELESKIGQVYKVMGSAGDSTITNWNDDANDEQTIYWSNFQNGEVWDINCSGNSTIIDISLKAGGVEHFNVTKGSNIVFVKDNSGNYKYGYFDNLGSTIVDGRVDGIVQRLNTDVGTRPNGFTGTLFDNVNALNQNVGTKPSHFTGTLFDTVYRSYTEFTSSNETGTFYKCGWKQICFHHSFQ